MPFPASWVDDLHINRAERAKPRELRGLAGRVDDITELKPQNFFPPSHSRHYAVAITPSLFVRSVRVAKVLGTVG
jgi:hypothetical protein